MNDEQERKLDEVVSYLVESFTKMKMTMQDGMNFFLGLLCSAAITNNISLEIVKKNLTSLYNAMLECHDEGEE